MTEILIADDETAIADSTAQLLQADGHSVATISSAAQILAALRRERPRVLLQDVRMPGLDLETTMRAIRADPGLEQTFVVLFTATMSIRDIAHTLGADEVIEKPYEPEDLLAMVRAWLDEARQRPRASPSS